MAALVQGYPQQSGTVTILQTKPTTASNIMAGTQPQPGQRNNFHGQPSNGANQTTYRGNSAGPVQPYAFTSTPGLANNAQWPQHGGYRTSASTNQETNSSRPSAPRQISAQGTNPSQPTFAQVAAAKASPERYRRPAPKHTDSSSSAAQQSSYTPGSAMPSGSGMANVAHLYNQNQGMAADPRKPTMPRNSAQLASSRPQSAYVSGMGASVDDIHVPRLRNDEDVKKFRRRSLHSIDFTDYTNPLTPREFKKAGETLRLEKSKHSKRSSSLEKEQKAVTRVVPVPAVEKNAAHIRTGSADSVVSTRSSNSRPSSANRNSNASAVPTTNSPASTSASGEKGSHQDHSKSVNVPPRSSSADVSGKRILNPSPLSQPANMTTGSSPGAPAPANSTTQSAPQPPATSHGAAPASPAAQQLAALNEKGKPKSKTSRLRRAFSFGSAAELRKVTGQEGPSDLSKTAQLNEANRVQKDPTPEELYEQEQARIAQKQEESGIGSSIYSGTKLFSGSTDNLSISSTASSASIMLRKMGRGMKKSSRSLVGLFRPKSVIGAPVGDSIPEGSQAAVSMITAEAERERVNVNANPHAQQAGGTGFPHLERNSMEAVKADSLQSDRPSSGNSAARKSIVGGERERAEVLATIRKGILKTRSDSPSPSPRAPETKNPTFELPAIPNISDSPISSAPSTPNDDQIHKRNGSITIGNEDYFMSALRLRQDTKSAPVTPQGPLTKRNATFSPRIVFHDTWPPGEYDRRGDIATCNRLTPMLAQQIKEELNTFKMEMEVHETSKIYTHFF